MYLSEKLFKIQAGFIWQTFTDLFQEVNKSVRVGDSKYS